jgi:hypothetical protein
MAYPELPITITPGSQTGSTVTVSIKQVWKSSGISWIATRFTDPSLDRWVCPKKDEVSPGFVDYGRSLTAACVNNVATIEVYVHDGTLDGQPDMTVPPECNPSSDYSKKIGYKFSVPCNVCVSGGPPPVKPPTKAPTKAPLKPPTKAPTKAPVKPPTKSPTKAPVKPPTKSPTKAPVKPPTKSPTKAPFKAPTKSPTKAPVKAPTKAPTAASSCPASLVGQQGTVSLPSMPIKVVPGSQTGGGTVQFQVEQVWKPSGSISWIAARFTNPTSGQAVCPKKNTVPSGLVNYANGAPGGAMEVAGACSSSWGYVITAKCVNNAASVQLYVHDGQYQGQPNINVPSECSPSNDNSKKISYNFTLPCSCP